MEIGTQEDNLAFGGPGGFFLAPKPNQTPTKERPSRERSQRLSCEGAPRLNVAIHAQPQAPYHLCAIGARHDLKSRFRFGTGIQLPPAGYEWWKFLRSLASKGRP